METLDSAAVTPVGSRSFYHRAADFAVFAIVFAFVVKFVSAKTPSPLGAWLSWTAEGVGFLAVPAGVIALFGIRRHGTKRLLWKGLLGVLLPIILFFVGVIAAIALREHALELMKQNGTK